MLMLTELLIKMWLNNAVTGDIVYFTKESSFDGHCNHLQWFEEGAEVMVSNETSKTYLFICQCGFYSYQGYVSVIISAITRCSGHWSLVQISVESQVKKPQVPSVSEG